MNRQILDLSRTLTGLRAGLGIEQRGAVAKLAPSLQFGLANTAFIGPM